LKIKQMEQTKQNLTLLITRINELFPDDGDLKGFLGISKALITDTLLQSDALLIPLKEYDNNFEVIVLKRELAELFEKVSRELDEKFEKIKPDKFQSFLKQITKIKFIIKETYISVASSATIRTEVEIAKAKEELTLLSSNNEELKRINKYLLELKETTVANIIAINKETTTLKEETVTINSEVIALKESAAIIVADFQAKQKISTDNEKLISEFLSTLETHKAAVEIIQKNTTTWEQDIKTAKESLTTKVSEFDALNDRSKNIQAEIESTHDKIFGKTDPEGKVIKGYLQETEDLKNQIATFLTEQQIKFLTQYKEIESLLPGATSAGLAEAYQKQKMSYAKPIQLWSWIFVVAIAAMTGLSIYLIYQQFQSVKEPTLNSAFISLLKDLPFFIPTIWLAAYASKQQSQYKRLQQEYAFKETNSKSFHGHKMQIEQLMKDGATDKDLLSQLVAQLVIITAYNPSETLDNKTHEDSPPIFKLLERYFPSIGKKKGGS
jgi:hypothetical protein